MTESEYDSREETRRYIESLRARLEKAKREKFTFLLVGRTGVGKSSSINSLLGEEVASVGDFAPETVEVKPYEGKAFGVSFTIVDTPGLCDALEEEGNDEKYLKLISDSRIKADCVWFVTRLDDTRVMGDEKRGIRMITQAFGKRIWNNAVIVFTFANASRHGITYREMLTTRHRLLREEIGRSASKEIAAQIPAVAVDNKSDLTPDGKPWLGELYTTAFERMSEQGSLPFLVATAERLVPSSTSSSGYPHSSTRHASSITLDEAQTKRVSQKASSVAIGGGALAGAAIGSVLGPVGALVGAGVGAALGWLFGRN